ncbi:YsnF/AvaK domain-containing protein [Modestobacter sp. VKM Ac-2979]|uniref:YsnF/AvaK domain-containing protein n=1 Tax=unclassified Modestobacter TaxID=2643866 RepID=UPI0022AB52D4|nr:MULTISPECIES: YsnF/AvaK domain-containing protein [unclassified Modestobacter]MCZ2811222.1 YsnF/AvaK domain-containing protein [Modestobacter sp. VKM Ac-2979]MCZ2840735.1 YsnF/AvaK domain-containing protein [Modestobacter sp. VKM Ac-2980]
MASDPTPPSVIGAIAHDRDGKPLGTVTAVYLDDVTEQPTWVGLTPGTHAAPDDDEVPLIAPVTGSQLAEDRMQLAVDSAAVHSAPRATRPDHLSPEEETALLEHYRGSSTTPARGGDGSLARRGEDVPARGGDGTMTLAEEQLDVTTVVEPWTRAVIRIEEVSEEVLVPVTITRQRARIEHLPLAHGDREPGQAATGERQPSRSTGWVTLYAEEPRVSLERVPAERVRLTTTWETEQSSVTEQLRHEEVDLSTADTPRD